MSGISLIQYRGAQDAYLSEPITGDNPFTHTWFRHTNFSQHQKRLTPNVPIKKQNIPKKYRFLVEKNGDLLKELYLKIKLDFNESRLKLDTTVAGANPRTNTVSDGLWRLQLYQIMESARLYIGGQEIEEIYPEWIIFYYSQIASDKFNAVDDATNPLYNTDGIMHLPLPFWFTRNAGTSIPLIALKNSKVEIEITLRDHTTFNKSVWISQPPLTGYSYVTPVYNPYESVVLDLGLGDNTYEVNMYAEYILLDSAERRRFQEQAQEYLITQVQRRIIYPKNKEGQQSIARGDTFTTGKFNLNHPCKYIMWYYLSNFSQSNGTADVSLNQTPWTGLGGQIPNTIKVMINGKDLVPERTEGWWRLYKAWELKQLVSYIPFYYYSWSSSPSKFQPTGQLNMSRIKDLEIITKRIDRDSGSLGCWVPFGPYFISTYGNLNDLRQVVMAENYNILRIDSGQAGVAFLA